MESWSLPTRSNKICYISFHIIPPTEFPQIVVHLIGTGMNRIYRIMVFYKNVLSQFTHIRNTQFTLIGKYVISPLGENLHSLIVDYTLMFKQYWITVLLLLNLHYQRRFCPNLNCYTMSDMLIRRAHKKTIMWTTFNSYFISSSTWAILLIDNLLRASATTFAIPRW